MVQLTAVILFVLGYYGHVVHVPSDVELSLSFHICLNRLRSREKEHLHILVN